jgi:dihydrofolate reductase
MNSLPKFVASMTLPEASWSNTTIMADDVPNVVARMKQEPGRDLAIIGSSGLASVLASRPH